ncbi:hypothetical protein MHH70_08570 [Metasolibacillus sp. FSL H7-0170]|uniref:hypothetical protein n=1 Tax=Metasolibacillus sp. FSL H7-0170 TaxID=2921431 RepID=UPI003158E932
MNVFPRGILNRLCSLVRVSWLFLFSKNNKVVINGNTLTQGIYKLHLVQYHFYAKILNLILNRAAKQNQLIIEINDLNYEQSIDLELNSITEKYDLLEREVLFNLNDVQYIFASKKMRQYAIRKYNIDKNLCFTIINGGDIVRKIPNEFTSPINKNEKLKFVYAGTLNKGRQIEELLELFSRVLEVELYLLGSGGEWINNNTMSIQNVFYLGAYEEQEAMKIMSLCDMGVIPYAEDRLYYNLCYPTKASTYITSGIPFISTKLDETMIYFKNRETAIFEDFNKWDEVILSLNKKQILLMKKEVNNIKEEFLWDELIMKEEKLFS